MRQSSCSCPVPCSSHNTVATVAAAPAAADQAALTEDQRLEWSHCVHLLTDLGVAEDQAERYIARAFGWGSQAYWRGEQVQVAPSVKQVQAALAYLNELGIQEQDMAKVLKSFPELVGCRVEQQLRANVHKLQNEWKLKDAVLAKAILRNPSVLGYTVDCMGDCAGECNRCWARF
eukprot:jgi/Chrzof1/510/Cz01g18140.t1